MVVGVWMLTMLVLTRSYSGNLTSLLAVSYIPMPIHSLQDIVDNPVTILLPRGTTSAHQFLVSGKSVLIFLLYEEKSASVNFESIFDLFMHYCVMYNNFCDKFILATIFLNVPTLIKDKLLTFTDRKLFFFSAVFNMINGIAQDKPASTIFSLSL